MENVLSHQMKRFVMDANKTIPNKENPDAPAEEVVFEEGEIYAIDIVMSTGEGKGVEGDTKTSLFSFFFSASSSLTPYLSDLQACC